MGKKTKAKVVDVIQLAKDQRHLSLLEKVRNSESLSGGEIKDLERFEKIKKRKEEKGKKNPVKKPGKVCGLFPKQEKFCLEYLVDLNATKAAKRAGYSPKSAYSQGQRMLKHVEIKKRIADLQEEQERRVEVKADQVIGELSRLAFSNMSDFISMGESGELEMKDLEELPREVMACISEISETETCSGRKIKFKLHDKGRALELLMKHKGMLTERLQVIEKGVDLSTMSDEELEAEYGKL